MTSLSRAIAIGSISASILLSGCGEMNLPHRSPVCNSFRSSHTITAPKVRSLLMDACGPHNGQICDESYWSPGFRWVNGAIRAYRRQLPASLKQWSKTWDCNKRSRDLQAYMSRRYALSSGKAADNPEGVACFVIGFTSDRMQCRHAVNVIIINGKVQFYDVDLWKFVNLSDRERLSTWYIGD